MNRVEPPGGSSSARGNDSRRTLWAWLVGGVGAVCVLGAIVAGREYGRLAARETWSRRLHSELRNVRQLGDDQAALQRLTEIRKSAWGRGFSVPAVEYDILYRKWRLVVQQFDTVRAARGNRYLREDAKEMLGGLQDRLYEIRDGCAEAIQGLGGDAGDVAWRLHNLRGNVSVVLAYTVLEFERDERKSLKFLGDALEDYKKAISDVDRSSTSSYERSLPRWNLELITARGELRRIRLGDAQQENLTEVRDQLEAVIPDMGGYAPGVPLETRVEK